MNTLPRPQAILFDWDNTLVETWPKLYKTINETLSEFGHDTWTMEQVKQRTHKSAKDIFPTLFGENHQKAKEYFYYLYRQKYAHESLPPLQNSLEVLELLKAKNIKTGVVSNKEGNTLRKEIKEMGWDIYFECMIGSMDARKDKPYPDPAFMALEKMNLQKGNHIWFVGDTTVDIECAYNSGCTPILYGDKIAAHGLETLNIPLKHVTCHFTLANLLEQALS